MIVSQTVFAGFPEEANVGVTLVVDGGRISAVDRHEEGITFGQITIPATAAVQPDRRDQVEREFLRWREEEMQRRYEKTQDRLLLCRGMQQTLRGLLDILGVSAPDRMYLDEAAEEEASAHA